MKTQKRRADPDHMQVIPNLWAIPGGEVLTASGLAILAARNGWKLTYVNADPR